MRYCGLTLAVLCQVIQICTRYGQAFGTYFGDCIILQLPETDWENCQLMEKRQPSDDGCYGRALAVVVLPRLGGA